ncbi:MAG: response regulator [Bryobacteraceae bacterium]|nr:response regulator [Bryobacteraceae bacterium]
MRGRALKVLLVEDDLDDLALFEEALLEMEERMYARKWMHPCELAPVDRISEAIECLQAESFDVILLDLTLPDAHGHEAFSRVRAVAPDVPIVVIAAPDDEALAISLIRQGAQDYLIKSELDCIPLARALRCAIERNRVTGALKSLAFIDDLTGLYTPGGFHSLAERLARIARLARLDLGVFVIDLDGIDAVEQTFGTQERDMALILAAEAVRGACAETDVVARLGPARFAVASLNGDPPDPAARIEELRAAVERGNSRRGGSCDIAVRVGFGLADAGEARDGLNYLDQLIQAAAAPLCENERNASEAAAHADSTRCYL